MSGGFTRSSRGIGAAFDATQVGVLRRLAADIEELMAARAAEHPDHAPQPAPGTDPLEALFADFTAGASTRPDDPVLARLLPDGYAAPERPDATDLDNADSADGPDLSDSADVPNSADVRPGVATPPAQPDFDADAASADFRRFHESDLRTGKSANAQLIRDSLPERGGSILLDDESAAAWLSGLNDMRLALGTALDVGPDTDREYARLDPMSSRARRLYLYFWLGLLQETLIDALTSD